LRAINPVTEQGTQGGTASIRLPYVLPESGAIQLAVSNRFASQLFLSGYIFGYKVQL
jgi:hypothetical protein